jgi:FAD/FMN-containing dehydrogenase
MSAIPPTADDHVCGIEYSPLLEGASYSRDHMQRFKNAIYDVGLDLGGSYYRFGGVMKPYVRRMFGDEMVNRHRAMKQQLDPAFILNRDVVFDFPEVG